MVEGILLGLGGVIKWFSVWFSCENRLLDGLLFLVVV